MTGRIAAASPVAFVLPSVAPAQEAIGEPIVYAVPGMTDVRVDRDVHFKTAADGSPLHVDVYHAQLTWAA